MKLYKCQGCGAALDNITTGQVRIICKYCRATTNISSLNNNGDFSHNADYYVEKGFVALAHKQWGAAERYFTSASRYDDYENAIAYLGLLLVELRIDEEQNLIHKLKDFSRYKNYQKAIQFADDELKEKLEKYNEIRGRNAKIFWPLLAFILVVIIWSFFIAIING